jgi:hypothetical protein
MTRALVFISLAVLSYSTAFSQKRNLFYCAGGGAIFAPWSYQEKAIFFPCFSLSPGIKFLQDKDFAMVLNFPISAGVTYKSDAFAGFDLPAMLNFHFGSAAGNNKDADMGIVLGAGASYLNVVHHYDETEHTKRHTEFWGYRFNLGLSFESDGEVPMIMFSYGRSISPNKGGMIGIGLQIIFL